MTKQKKLTQKQAYERNQNIRDFLIKHKQEIKDEITDEEEVGFSITEIAKRFDVTYSVIDNLEKGLRAKKKLSKRDGFITPTGEFAQDKPMRKSKRAKELLRRAHWDRNRLCRKLGFSNVNSLVVFAINNKIKLTHSKKSEKRSKTAQSGLQKEIRDRLAERITQGDLVSSEVGANKLFELIFDEFTEKLKRAKLSFTKKGFPSLLDEVVWTKPRLDLLMEVMQSDLPDSIGEFCKSNHNIPRGMVEVKSKYIKGVTSQTVSPAAFVPGLGRLDLDEMTSEEIARFRLPEATASNPYKIDVGDPTSAFTVNVINGPNIGLAYAINIKHNVPRRCLAESRIRGTKVVIMSGLFELDLRKAAGPLKVHRALVSGLRVNWEKLEVSYQKEAKRIIEGRKDTTAKDIELLYPTIAERLELAADAWHKVSHRPKNRKHSERGNVPEFDGPVLIVFGYKEEEMITSAAYWEARWLTLKKQTELRMLLKLRKHELVEESEMVKPDEKEIKRLEKETTRLARQLARTIITNVSEEDLTRQFRRILPLVVKKFENAIPNSKVIGLGTSYIQFGDKVGEFNIPDHTKPTPALLSNYTKAYSPKVLRRKMADFVVILHPHAVSYRSIDRSCDIGGRRKSLLVHVAPIAIDAHFLRNKLRNTVRKVHPISKLVFSEQFEPGMLTLDFHNGMIDGYSTDISALALHESKEERKSGGWKHIHLPLIHDPVLRYINLVTRTDLHYGSRSREHVWDPVSGQWVGCDEIISLLTKRSGLHYTSDFPFHMECMNDDGVQGNHLRIWQQQPDPQELPQAKIDALHQEWKVRSDKARSLADIRDIMEEAAKLNLRQFLLRPPDWLQNQLRYLCHRYVDQNIGFFGSVLSKALTTQLVFRGMSHFEGTLYDSRDIGCINTGSGNHATKGTGGEMTEGWLISDRIWLRLLGDPNHPMWRELGEEKLRSLVRSPLYSNIFVAWGTVQAPGGYEWAFDLRSSPPKMKGWTDTLAGWVFVDPSRGNYARLYENPESNVEEGRVVIKTCGDKHFHASARTPYAQYVMCAPCTHTDQFAEMAGGLPPNSTGITSICLPKDGPGSGPIIVRFFPFEHLKYFVEHPEVEIDWNAMFPNPL